MREVFEEVYASFRPKKQTGGRVLYIGLRVYSTSGTAVAPVNNVKIPIQPTLVSIYNKGPAVSVTLQSPSFNSHMACRIV